MTQDCIHDRSCTDADGVIGCRDCGDTFSCIEDLRASAVANEKAGRRVTVAAVIAKALFPPETVASKFSDSLRAADDVLTALEASSLPSSGEVTAP